MKKLFLFDIDGTLLKNSGVHGEAFRKGFKEIYGIDATRNCIDRQGKTDKQILIEILRKYGIKENRIFENINICMELMSSYYKDHIEEAQIQLFEGVLELLERLSHKGHSMGLVTGNLRDIALSKMEKMNIKSFFSIGGFGDEGAERSGLAELAIERGFQETGISGKEKIFLVGDTPLDILAGKKKGIKTVGVATGIFSKEELESYYPDYTVENVKELQEKKEILVENTES